MKMLVFLVAASLLAVERLTYVWVWRRPDRFASLCAGAGRGITPVDALARLFRVFKLLQAAVFVGWCLWCGGGELRWQGPGTPALAVTAIMAATGQALNAAVFRRLGRVGVFYGSRFGHDVAWCTGFPFSMLDHPQYIGALLSIWAFFVLARYPEPDWIVLPLLETAYYALGARFERHGGSGTVRAQQEFTMS